MLGIVVAMDSEMELLLSNLHQHNYKVNENVFKTYEFNISNKEFVGIVSGVGKIKASAATEYLLSRNKISKVLNFGMAGGIDESVNIGDIVNIVASFDNDEDLSAFGHEKVKRELVSIADFDAAQGICVSGDKFVNDNIEAENINKRYKALCYEMELSAIALVCNMHKIPVLSIKYISDKADENAEFDFDESLKKAANQFSDFITEMINKL
jgi:5'-methylthioadenosine/S-adenosylhomocysteine nucleosidase